jgi:hypothetical protein
MLLHHSMLSLLLISITSYLMPTQFLDRGSGRLEATAMNNYVAVNQRNNMTFDLNSYQWKNRLLLVFAPNENSPAYQRQMQLFQGKQADVQERDLLLVEIFTEGTSRAAGKKLDDGEITRVRSQFNVDPQKFQTILVGKDGQSKRREDNPINPEVIFQQIDAMPMRQREMQGDR